MAVKTVGLKRNRVENMKMVIPVDKKVLKGHNSMAAPPNGGANESVT